MSGKGSVVQANGPWTDNDSKYFRDNPGVNCRLRRAYVGEIKWMLAKQGQHATTVLKFLREISLPGKSLRMLIVVGDNITQSIPVALTQKGPIYVGNDGNPHLLENPQDVADEILDNYKKSLPHGVETPVAEGEACFYCKGKFRNKTACVAGQFQPNNRWTYYCHPHCLPEKQPFRGVSLFLESGVRVADDEMARLQKKMAKVAKKLGVRLAATAFEEKVPPIAET